MPLTIHLEGGLAEASARASGVLAPPPGSSPLLRVSTSGRNVPLVSGPAHRLPAVLSMAAAAPPSYDQRARMDLMEIFDAPHNLPVVAFAKLAGKSRRWVSYEIQAGNLLALRVGNQGQRVPDWHLNPTKHALIQAVLKLNRDAYPWQIYHALLEPRAELRDQPAIEAVTAHNLDGVIAAVSLDIKERLWKPPSVA